MNTVQKILLVGFGFMTAVCLWKSDGLQHTDLFTVWGGGAAIWITLHFALATKKLP